MYLTTAYACVVSTELETTGGQQRDRHTQLKRPK